MAMKITTTMILNPTTDTVLGNAGMMVTVHPNRDVGKW